jgi:type IV secretion system protein VirB4
VLTPDVPWHLDVYLSDAKVTVDTDCTVDEDHVVTASVHDVPGETHAGMVSRIMQAPFEFRLVTRYTFLSDATAKGKIKTIRRTQFQKRKGVGAMFSEAATGEKTEVEDTDATNLAAEASDALEALTDPVTKFGYLTTSIVVRDPNYRRAVQRLDELRKLVNDEGFIVKQETFGNPFVFLGSLPGNISYNARQPMLSTKNLAHHYPISQPWEGDYRNDHLYHLTGADWPHIAARAGNSPFFVNLNYGDVGHTFVVGPTGSGKSILLNTLAIQWLRYPDTRVVFFDKDRTSRPATINTGGSFYDLGSDDAGLLLNPFADIHDPGHRAWLSQFLAHYLRDKQIDVSTRDENELHAAVEHMATLEPDALKFETFRDNIQHEEIRAALHPFIEGEYAHLFTSDSDTIAQNRWTTFEMGTLMTMDEYIVRFVLAYLFQKLSRIFGGTPTLMLLDESFMYLDNPTFRTMLRDWLKVLRKQHVYVALATQDIADVANSPIFSTVLNACQTRILLPNPRAMEGTNYELYQAMGLTDGDILGLRDARNKREYFYVGPKGKQLFELNLNPTQLDILERVRTEHLESGIT